MANTYDVGDLVRVTGTFTDSSGNAQDPTAVYCAFKDPSGNVTTYQYGQDAALEKSSTGVYYVDIDVDEAGVWYYRWYATGTGQAAGESTFSVREQEVT